ncbi:MAG: leucine-rich repeat protein [Oscillospiraceae bacterium]
MFENCTNLSSVTIPNGVTRIGEGAFRKCESLDCIIIPNSVTSIGDSAFSNCESLTSVTISDSVTSIGKYTFYNCSSLTSVTIPDGVTSIGYMAFENCKSLESVTIPNSVTSIGDYAFEECRRLTSIEIPDSVTSVGAGAFGICTSLKDITIPNSVRSIGIYAFKYCRSLTSITIPDSVTNIGKHAFFYCTSLNNIYVNSKNKYYSSENGVLFNKNKDELVQYPVGNSRTSYSIPNGVTSIGEYAFLSCDSLTKIVIPDSVTSIESSVFDKCTSLTDVYYTGSEEDWDKISIGKYNDELTNANIHFHTHSYKSEVTKSATCTAAGERTYTCAECGDTYTETISATGHTAVTDEAVAATCTADGKTEGSHCSVCGEVIKAQETVPATGHKFGAWKTTKKATCKETGTQTRTCSACGKTETKTIAKTAHTYKTTVVEPTYESQGYTLHTCTECGESYKDNYTPKKTVATVKPTTFSCTDTAIRINWNKVEDAAGYRIYRYNTSTKKWEKAATLSGADTLTYKQTGLKAGTTYKYKVKAYAKSDGKTYWGESSDTMTTTTKPAKVVMKSSYSSTASAVRINWNTVTGATGYRVYRYDPKTKKYVVIATIKDGSANTYRDSGRKAKTSYQYKVKAYRKVNDVNYWGEASDVKTCKTK